MTQPHNHSEREVTEAEGLLLPKTDEKGRIYREVRCANCRAFLCDEYVHTGRIRIKCFRCGRITILVFRSRRSKRSPGPANNTNLKEETHE